MQLIFILLLAIVSLAMNVRALRCYTNGAASTYLDCDSDTIYCLLVSSTQDLQTYLGASCLSPYSGLCSGADSNGCKLNGGNYYYCCTTDYCNTKVGHSCAATTTSTTTTSTTTTAASTTTTATSTPATTISTPATSSTTTSLTGPITTTKTPSASSNLLPSSFLIFSLTTVSFLMTLF